MIYRSVVDVHLILQRDDGRVLLAERNGTGYADGLFNIPGGKLEDGEDVRTAAIREAREELGVEITPADVRFVGIVHHRNPGRQARIGFFFTTTRWTGEPTNTEPHKCARLTWADPRDLPPNTITYSAAGITQLLNGHTLTLDGWDTTTTTTTTDAPLTIADHAPTLSSTAR